LNDDEFLRQFENCSLPFEAWNQRAHVKVAFLYLRDHPFDHAVARIRTGIKAYNRAHEVPESDTRGYNETTTRAMMQLVAATIAAYENAIPAPTADAFCESHPQLLNKHILRLFYSPEQRMHPDAKIRFVEPDLTQLPRILPTQDGNARD
jgi:hypothetical protein